MKRSISIELVQSVKPQEKPFDVRDTRVKGFILRVQPSGVKTYYVEYGRGRRKKIGRADALRSDEARIEARKVLATAYKGEDPKAEDRKQMVSSLELFMDEIYEPWADAHLKHGKLACDRVRRNFEKLLKRPMTEIAALDIERWRTKRFKQGRKPSTVNRDVNVLKAVFSRAVRWKFLDENPILDVKLSRVDPFARCRFLNEDEMDALRNALAAPVCRVCDFCFIFIPLRVITMNQKSSLMQSG